MIKDYQQFDLFGKKTFIKAIIEPPFMVSGEMPDDACFYYVVTGCADVITPTQRITTHAGDGLVMRCGNYLNEYLTAKDMEYCEAIAIHLNPEVLRMIYDKEFPNFLLNVQNIKPINYERMKASTLLKNYMDNLQFYFANPELVSEELLKIKLKELILLLAKTDNAEMIQSLIAGLFTKSAVHFKEVVEANLYHNLTIEQLAILTNLSLSSFKREFVKHYNNSPARYIKQRKLQRASKMLKSTQLRISDIAYDCGFSDLAHFSKSFQKAYGLAPSDYRLN